MLILGDCPEELKKLAADSVDALVTDPPYFLTDSSGKGFMGKEWDSLPEKNAKEWHKRWAMEVFRVLKPGAHGLVFGGTRTSHHMVTGPEEAGFEIRDSIVWCYGSGFPKSTSISKQIDKMAGAERKIVGINRNHRRSLSGEVHETGTMCGEPHTGNGSITDPATPEAKQWDGWGSALKPAHEPIALIRKPISEKTLTKNVLKHGTGAINIDASRIGTELPNPRNAPKKIIRGGKFHAGANAEKEMSYYNPTQGRWPANILFSHLETCQLVGTKEVKGGNDPRRKDGSKSGHNFHSFDQKEKHDSRPCGHEGFGENGKETVEAWLCDKNCPVAELDKQSGILKSGSGQKSKNRNTPCYQGGFKSDNKEFERSMGGASRFFYCAKASKRDRGEGNTHPTVKNTKLMEYLIKLVTPLDGIVLDPFAGSGSTLVAAKRLGFEYIGIEKEAEYFEIAQKRIEAEHG